MAIEAALPNSLAYNDAETRKPLPMIDANSAKSSALQRWCQKYKAWLRRFDELCIARFLRNAAVFERRSIRHQGLVAAFRYFLHQ